MEITEVRIKLMEASEDRLRAFCSITFDSCFVIRDLKIIAGTQGPFVAMPSRKLTHRCNRCGNKNHIRSNYCNNCGGKIKAHRHHQSDEDSPNKLYADVAHPINQACRDQIQEHVVREYELELERAKIPGYVSRYDDAYEAIEPVEHSADSVPKPHLDLSDPKSDPKERAKEAEKAGDKEQGGREDNFN